MLSISIVVVLPPASSQCLSTSHGIITTFISCVLALIYLVHANVKRCVVLSVHFTHVFVDHVNVTVIVMVVIVGVGYELGCGFPCGTQRRGVFIG